MLSHGKGYAAHAEKYCSIAKSQQEQIQQTKSALNTQDLSVLKNGKLSEKKEYFINISDDDDEVNNSRKQIITSKYAFALAYSFTLHHFYKHPETRLPFCSHFSYTSSYKYIFQRVLRI